MRRLAKLGDKTTNGYVASATSSMIDGKNLALNGDRAWCNKCKGMFGIIGTARGWSEGSLFVGNGDRVTCKCGDNQVIATSNLFDEGGGSSQSKISHQQSLVKSLTNDEEKEAQEECTHSDGAIKVAGYILNEIKTNVKSTTADDIRFHIDKDIHEQRMKEWEALPWYLKSAPPKYDLLSASAIWFMAVKTGAKWDHKPKIRDMFSSVAVARPLPDSGTNSKSYFHKYKGNDYFYDVWPNIHYGYVGLSVGFSEDWLLLGSTIEQWRTSKEGNADPADDITCMKIGMALYRQYGKYAESLTVNHIINALEAASGDSLSVSKQTHWCWNEDNPEKINNPG